VLGAIGLLLATIGLYGILAWSASARTREIGIRMALGARSVDVLRMIGREGVALTMGGLAIGLLLAWGATRLATGLLFGVSPLDGIAYAGMSGVFLVVACLASWLPARRAARADPAAVLRGE
jgi:putative ABC transport system permease protein